MSAETIAAPHIHIYIRSVLRTRVCVYKYICTALGSRSRFPRNPWYIAFQRQHAMHTHFFTRGNQAIYIARVEFRIRWEWDVFFFRMLMLLEGYRIYGYWILYGRVFGEYKYIRVRNWIDFAGNLNWIFWVNLRLRAAYRCLFLRICKFWRKYNTAHSSFILP